jgi:type IV secretory pathway VirB2 component (pilin)
MRLHRPTPRALAVLLLAGTTVSARSASAAPPLVGLAQDTLGFLTGTLGPIVFGIGLAICALGLIMGNRDALQRGIWAIVGGGMLFGIDQIVGFVQAAT